MITKKFGLVDCSLLVIVIVLQDETRVGLRSGAFKSSDANHRLRYFPSCWHFESVTGCVYVGSTFCGVLSDPHHIQSTHNSRTSSLQFQNCFNYSFFLYMCFQSLISVRSSIFNTFSVTLKAIFKAVFSSFWASFEILVFYTRRVLKQFQSSCKGNFFVTIQTQFYDFFSVYDRTVLR